MNQTELLAVILGLVAVLVPLALSIMAAFMSHTHHKQVDELAWAIISVTESLKGQADRALAPYGAALAPLHEGIGLAQSLVDDDNDALVKALRNSTVIAAFRAALKELEALTDGVPPTEAIPKGETAPENNIG